MSRIKFFFFNLPIRKKMLFALFSIAAVTLLMQTCAIFYVQLATLEKSMARRYVLRAKIIAENVNAALVFSDPDFARKILSALQVDEQIRFAAIYDGKGRLFAQYLAKDQTKEPAFILKAEGHTFSKNHFEVISPVILDGEKIGNVSLYARDSEMQEHITHYLELLAFIISMVLLIAYFCANLLQKIISDPILSLAQVADKIAFGLENPTAIGAYAGSDEIGTLYAAFSKLLEQVQSRTSELLLHQKNLEAMVEKRTRELTESREQLLVKEKLALLGELSAKVSHELRNPLASIRTATFLVGQTLAGSTPHLDLPLDIIERNVRRCCAIIDELLDFARPSRAVGPATPALIDEWLKVLLAEYHFNPQIKVSLKLVSGALVNMDRERCHRVMINILDNATHALLEQIAADGDTARGDGAYCLQIETCCDEQHAKIIVRDTGSGITPDGLKNIFKPLYSTKSFGVGLGLVICNEIMKSHGGKINLASMVNHGTTVTLYFPKLKSIPANDTTGNYDDGSSKYKHAP